jgi:hypothetical protein
MTSEDVLAAGESEIGEERILAINADPTNAFLPG